MERRKTPIAIIGIGLLLPDASETLHNPKLSREPAPDCEEETMPLWVGPYVIVQAGDLIKHWNPFYHAKEVNCSKH